MKLHDLLKEIGLPANEIRARFKANLIEVNGESKDGDYNIGNISNVYDQGFFLEKLYELPNYEKHYKQIVAFGLENLMSGESNIKNDLTDYLEKFKMIKLSKSKFIFVEKAESEVSKINFHMEEVSLSGMREIEKTEKPKINTEKLLKDKEKVEKQLNNPGFLNNAPKFKIDAAKNRLERIEKQLEELNENKIFKFSDFK